MSGRIPAIDIAPFLAGTDKASVARQVAEACERIGFLVVSGHGIEAAVIERAFERSRAFFDRPRDEKDRCHPRGPARQRGFHGFATRGLAYTLGEETAARLARDLFPRARRRPPALISRTCPRRRMPTHPISTPTSRPAPPRR